MKKLTGNQSKLDLNKNGKLDAEDFKMLRSNKMAKGTIVKDGGSIDLYYQAEYYDKQGGHGALQGYSSNFDKEYRKAMELYTREKKSGELGKSTGFIGVSGSGQEFAILYIDKNYFDNMSENDFSTKSDYDVWMKVAKSVLETGKAKKGSYNMMKNGGSTVKDNRMNERTRAVILKIQKTGIHPDDVSPNFVNEIAYDNGIELKSEEVVFISDNYGKKSMANGGSTKGFEYSIGGL
jgi:hypothetical protein